MHIHVFVDDYLLFCVEMNFCDFIDEEVGCGDGREDGFGKIVDRMHSRFMEMNLLGYGDDEKEDRGGR